MPAAVGRSRTATPGPRRATLVHRPSGSSWRKASRTSVRLTPSISHSSRSIRRDPCGKRSVQIAERSRSVTLLRNGVMSRLTRSERLTTTRLQFTRASRRQGVFRIEPSNERGKEEVTEEIDKCHRQVKRIGRIVPVIDQHGCPKEVSQTDQVYQGRYFEDHHDMGD